jgi:hypothetical protein
LLLKTEDLFRIITGTRRFVNMNIT